MPEGSLRISFLSRDRALEVTEFVRYGGALGSSNGVRLFVVKGLDWLLQQLDAATII